MFTEEELDILGKFLNIRDNKENVLLHLESKNTKNQWLLVDFSDKFEERYGIYYKASNEKNYKPFNQVKALSNMLNLISKFEVK